MTTTIDSNQPCLCNSGVNSGECCLPILKAYTKATTAEALMRARYSAHVLGEIDFIVDTFHPKSRSKTSRATIEKWAMQTKWTGLEVLSVLEGGPTDTVGKVIFKAHYDLQGKAKFHHEDAVFTQEDGTWYYLDGSTPKTQPKRSFKLGRNEPCHCGSGKKYKKCCAKK